MKLSEIITYLADNVQIEQIDKQSLSTEITGIAYDSRKVKPGYLFVAIKGGSFDGHDFISQAVEKKAAALLVEQPLGISLEIPVLVSKDSRRTMALIAAHWWQHPDQKMRMIGVTGTNGKTTTTKLIKWLLESAGRKTGLIGTIDNQSGDKILPATHTTPESYELFELLHTMKEDDCKNAVLEVSSHGLKQRRVYGCSFDGVVFTNLTQDHLDYHVTWEDYLNSKLELFKMISQKAGQNKYAVVNLDDEVAEHFLSAATVDVWTYSMKEEATLRVLDYKFNPSGTDFTLLYRGKKQRVHVPLIGKFNIYNALAAMVVALAEGLTLTAIIKYLAKAPQVAGRFELVSEGQDFKVVVDYAHSPDGLLNVLLAAQDLDPRHLICVFGCGGDRDKTKRPIMGKIAAENSDFAVITSDNPRTEDPFVILDQIEVGVKEGNGRYIIEENRKAAISAAIKMAQAGDLVVIAGKGHEDYQLVKGQVLHCDDREIARAALKEKLKNS
jgi:UDP-N-acetylmuramoyl-L-alanyl-D-glutamate--2,6-diaminopimelate ligase